MNIFSKPYKLNASPIANVRMALLFGGFVFFFLYIFQPFQLNTYSGSLLQLCLGYGAVCVIMMLLLNVLFVQIWPKLLQEERWTVGKQIGWTIVNVTLIGLMNALYSNLMGVSTLNVQSIFYLEMYTLALAVFPVSAVVLLNESRLNRKFSEYSKPINSALEERNKSSRSKIASKASELIQIPSENAEEGFAVRPENLLFMKAAENYTEIYLREKANVERRIVRINLRRLEDVLKEDDSFLRCHKSYIVNLALVVHISGNAQGFKLHMVEHEALIPVSRKFNSSIKELLQKVN